MVVNAELVEGGGFDAVEAVGHIAELQCAAVTDRGGGSPGQGFAEKNC